MELCRGNVKWQIKRALLGTFTLLKQAVRSSNRRDHIVRFSVRVRVCVCVCVCVCVGGWVGACVRASERARALIGHNSVLGFAHRILQTTAPHSSDRCQNYDRIPLLFRWAPCSKAVLVVFSHNLTVEDYTARAPVHFADTSKTEAPADLLDPLPSIRP